MGPAREPGGWRMDRRGEAAAAELEPWFKGVMGQETESKPAVRSHRSSVQFRLEHPHRFVSVPRRLKGNRLNL